MVKMYILQEQVEKYRNNLVRNRDIAIKTNETLENLIKNASGKYIHNASQASSFLMGAIKKFNDFYKDLTDEYIVEKYATYNKENELKIYVRWDRDPIFLTLLERQEKAKAQIANIAYDLWGE